MLSAAQKKYEYLAWNIGDMCGESCREQGSGISVSTRVIGALNAHLKKPLSSSWDQTSTVVLTSSRTTWLPLQSPSSNGKKNEWTWEGILPAFLPSSERKLLSNGLLPPLPPNSKILLTREGGEGGGRGRGRGENQPGETTRDFRGEGRWKFLFDSCWWWDF